MTALEGVVENGRVRLLGDATLPDQTRVFVVVPDADVEGRAHERTPRLARADELADFVLEVAERP